MKKIFAFTISLAILLVMVASASARSDSSPVLTYEDGFGTTTFMQSLYSDQYSHISVGNYFGSGPSVWISVSGYDAKNNPYDYRTVVGSYPDLDYTDIPFDGNLERNQNTVIASGVVPVYDAINKQKTTVTLDYKVTGTSDPTVEITNNGGGVIIKHTYSDSCVVTATITTEDGSNVITFSEPYGAFIDLTKQISLTQKMESP